MPYVDPKDASYKPIEAAMINAIRTITATKTDRLAWMQFALDHPEMIASLRAAVAKAQ